MIRAALRLLREACCVILRSDSMSNVTFCPSDKVLKRSENNSGEMHKYIISTLIIRNKTKTLALVEPFYCTFIHQRYLLFLCIFHYKKITCPDKSVIENLTLQAHVYRFVQSKYQPHYNTALVLCKAIFINSICCTKILCRAAIFSLTNLPWHGIIFK